MYVKLILTSSVKYPRSAANTPTANAHLTNSASSLDAFLSFMGATRSGAGSGRGPGESCSCVELYWGFVVVAFSY